MGWIYLALVITSLFGFLSWNIRRSQKRFQYDLKPNCLLTKHPVVFVDGKKSLFYFLSYWNNLPQFLSQHGYEVLEYDLHWRNPQKRIKEIKEFLEEAERHNFQSPLENQIKYHFIIDRSSLEEFKSLFSKESFNSVASCTLVTNRSPFFPTALKHPIEEIIVGKTKKPFTIKFFWLLHRFWTQSWDADLVSLGLQIQNHHEHNDEILKLQNALLDRAVLLAERDLLLNATNLKQRLKTQQGTHQHDITQDRASRDSSSTQELPPPSC